MPTMPEPTILDPEDSVKEIHDSKILLLRQTSTRKDRWLIVERYPDNKAGQAAAHSDMLSHESARGGVWRIVRQVDEILERWD